MNYQISEKLLENLENENVEDIVLSPKGLSFFKEGEWSQPQNVFETEKANLWYLANKIAEENHIQLGLTQPSVDSILILGEKLKFRAHVAVFPLIETGPEITLRRLPTLERFDLSNFFLTDKQEHILLRAISEKKSILVSGSTGSGKTSFLTALMKYIKNSERTLVLEDSPELPIPNLLSTKLLCRSDRFGFREGASWNLEDLVFESLRMRPDRLIVGECRSTEAKAIAQALLTGHRGLWTSIHAGSCEEALERFADLASINPEKSKDLWDCCVQLKQNKDGKREIASITNPGKNIQ